ncbi:hypothetical protein NLJ89_g857 [Agrocybe chaxingu]|uniref:CN hydrolase domain-containing protein n=1 Tax=Agrocybe chaxingu TaxID=84603 RepID=A0A9W8N144_9AGAR|nr:hypothetical protein NLJ89_g857 [Agrocybe chaxingu]
MPKPRVNLRIGVVQFSPKYTCFSAGYVFENAAAISPFLEKPRTGPTCQFCSELAKKLECYVIAGYPEVLDPAELNADDPSPVNGAPNAAEGPDKRPESSSTSGSTTKREQVGTNSAALYGLDGEWIGGYRKSYLYETDLAWAKQGEGFKTFHLPSPLNTVCLGICMDLNPQSPWTLERGPYELADYCVAQNANVLILLNAWLDSKTETEETSDWSTLNYWASRLRPLWTNGDDVDKDGQRTQADVDPQDGEKEIVVVVCNRCGEENGTLFAGTSAIFSMVAGSGRPKLLDMMERREEGVRIWNIRV